MQLLTFIFQFNEILLWKSSEIIQLFFKFDFGIITEGIVRTIWAVLPRWKVDKPHASVQRRTIGDSISCVVKKLETSVSVLRIVGTKFCRGILRWRKSGKLLVVSRSDEDFENRWTRFLLPINYRFREETHGKRASRTRIDFRNANLWKLFPPSLSPPVLTALIRSIQ